MPPTRAGALNAERVGQALGEWQAGEVRLARRFAECRGLNGAQLEDLYQETALALLHRPYNSEEHLRNALRFGLKNRALHLHRDERRRGEILADRAPEMHGSAMARDELNGPEQALLAREDQLIVKEFATELTALEKKIFGLEAEGMRYRAIAPMLGVSVNEARKASRSWQRKRERFQLLHDTGRLCGYRSHTIQALKAGERTSEQLMLGAYAHLDACASCRAEHKTNARRLRRSFQHQAAALLPIPAVAQHLGWLARLDMRIRALQQRLAPSGSAPGGGGVREGAAALATGSGVAAKLAAGVATVAVIAGGTLGATHVLSRAPRQHHPAPVSRHLLSTPLVLPAPRAQAALVGAALVGRAPTRRPQRPAPRSDPAPRAAQESSRREPGGFAYLGVPTANTPREAQRPTATAAAPGERTGGPFTP